MTLDFFDAYCAFGPLGAPGFSQEFVTAGDLLRAMDEVGIKHALVYSTVARELDPNLGNTHLIEAIRSQERLHSCWVLVPHYTGEMPPPGELIPILQQNGVRAVRLYPGPDGHNLACVTWDLLATMLMQYPPLPLVLTGLTYRADRYLYPLWDAHANLYVETSGYQGHHAVEAVVSRFGPERLLFGTNMPRYSPGAAIAAITYADISPEAKSAIAGDNLFRLLETAYGS